LAGIRRLVAAIAQAHRALRLRDLDLRPDRQDAAHRSWHRRLELRRQTIINADLK
jgi:hypothetical protein